MKTLLSIALLIVTCTGVWGQGPETFLKFFTDADENTYGIFGWLQVAEQYPGRYIAIGRSSVHQLDGNGEITRVIQPRVIGAFRTSTKVFPSFADSSALVFGTNLDTSLFYIDKIDKNGNYTWRKEIGANDTSFIYGIDKVRPTNDGGYIVAGDINATDGSNISWYVLKVDATGDSLWFTDKVYNYVHNAVVLPDNTILIGSSTGEWLHFDAQGNPIDTLSNIWGDMLNNNQFATNGNPYNGDTIISMTHDSIYKHSPMGTVYARSGFNLQIPFRQFSIQQLIKAKNGFICIGKYSDTSTTNPNVFGGLGVIKFKEDLSLEYVQNYELAETEFLFIYGDQNFNVAQDGSITVGGAYSLFGGTKIRGFVAKLDSNGHLFNNLIEGQIYLDDNQNCQRDPGEQPISNWIVIAEGTFNHYAFTDDSGRYSIPVDTGTYTMSNNSPSSYWNPGCNANNVVTLNAFSDTAIFNDGLSANILCPNLEVQISTWGLRPCFRSTYFARYCNYGTVTADSAYVDITLDRFLTMDSATLAYDSLGNNVYRVYVGRVSPGQCGNFRFYVILDCSIELGSTHCVEAHINPDSICGPPDPIWEGASLRLEAACENNDTVAFRIINDGQSMTSPAEYSIIQDDVMYAQEGVQLNSGQALRVPLAANGATWTMAVQQVAGHPGNSHPLKSVEGCGLNGQGTYSMGFITLFPPDDADLFIDIECTVSRASFDPNDKTPSPLGVGTEGLIEENQRISYKVRFQNTGTDTAFTVIIRDTLTALLDMTTLRLGPSSHEYTFSINQRELVWRFDNILLPDSNVNEPLSHGFVTFSVDQVADLQPGTVIANRAGIFFDFNDVVLTNTTKNTITDSLWRDLDVSVSEIYSRDGINRLYPNPSNGQLIVDLSGVAAPKATLVIYDIYGRRVLNKEYGGNQIKAEQINLSNGIYFYELLSNNEKVATGKLIVQ